MPKKIKKVVPADEARKAVPSIGRGSTVASPSGRIDTVLYIGYMLLPRSKMNAALKAFCIDSVPEDLLRCLFAAGTSLTDSTRKSSKVC